MYRVRGASLTGYALVLVAVTAAIVGAVLGAAFLPLPSSVSASEHTAKRSFAPETVVPGGDVVVTISASGYGQFGGVVETLPLGFIYKSSSRPDTAVRVDGQDVTFALFGESSFTYTVTAPSVEDAHIFSGRVKNDQGDYNDVGGASSVTVAARAVGGHAGGSHCDEIFHPGDGCSRRRRGGNDQRQRVRPVWRGRGDIAPRVHLQIE